jgi:hypothetical protein
MQRYQAGAASCCYGGGQPQTLRVGSPREESGECWSGALPSHSAVWDVEWCLVLQCLMFVIVARVSTCADSAGWSTSVANAVRVAFWGSSEDGCRCGERLRLMLQHSSRASDCQPAIVQPTGHRWYRNGIPRPAPPRAETCQAVQCSSATMRQC